MKVLHIIDSLGLGGAQTVVKGIFEAQPDNKDIFLLALREREITTAIRHPNVQIYPSSSKYSLAPLLALKRLMEREKIDVIHCHLFRSNVFGVLIKSVLFRNVKLVIHEHGQILQQGLFYPLSLSLSGSSINRLIAISSHVRSELLTKTTLSKNKIVVVQNFVDHEKFNTNVRLKKREIQRDRHGITPAHFVVGFAGRISHEKGWVDLVHAAKENLKSPPLLFVIAGDGNEKEKMISMISAMGIDNRVLYLGHRPDANDLYALADCVLVPSVTEGFGLSAIEAMATGLPVICSNVPGLCEIVSHNSNGLVYVRGVNDSPHQIIKAIELLQNRKIYERLSTNSRNTADQFGLTRFLTRVNDIYAS